MNADVAESQPPAFLAGISALRRHSSDTLEGGDASLPFKLVCVPPKFLQLAHTHIHHLSLHLVPNYIRVVAAAETWTGNIPSLIHKQIFRTVFRLVAFQTCSLQHLQVEGPVPATGQQKKKRR